MRAQMHGLSDELKKIKAFTVGLTSSREVFSQHSCKPYFNREQASFEGGGFDEEFQQALKASLNECQVALAQHRHVRAKLSHVIPQNTFIQDIARDGNCLFSSFAVGYNQLFQTAVTHVTVREVCVCALREHF